MTDDPMDGADVGETRTVRETEQFALDPPLSYYGTDRLGEPEVSDVEVIETDAGGLEMRIEWEGDVTKRLPRRWDTAREPRTDSERATARRKRWIGRAITAGVTVLTLGLGLTITNYVMTGAAQGMTIDGEPLTWTPWDLVPVVVIMLLAVAVVYGIKYLPRPGPGVGR